MTAVSVKCLVILSLQSESASTTIWIHTRIIMAVNCNVLSLGPIAVRWNCCSKSVCLSNWTIVYVWVILLQIISFSYKNNRYWIDFHRFSCVNSPKSWNIGIPIRIATEAYMLRPMHDNDDDHNGDDDRVLSTYFGYSCICSFDAIAPCFCHMSLWFDILLFFPLQSPPALICLLIFFVCELLRFLAMHIIINTCERSHAHTRTQAQREYSEFTLAILYSFSLYCYCWYVCERFSISRKKNEKFFREHLHTFETFEH